MFTCKVEFFLSNYRGWRVIVITSEKTVQLSKLNKTKTNYLSWQTLLISKVSTIIGKINSRPGSKSKVNSISKIQVVPTMRKTELNGFASVYLPVV